MGRRAGLLLLAAHAAAGAAPLNCAPAARETRVIPPGRYAYRATLVVPGGDTLRREGTLVVDGTTPDSLAGRWEVPGYPRAFARGSFDFRSYRLETTLDSLPDRPLVIHNLYPPASRDGRVRCAVAVTITGYWWSGECSAVKAP